MRRPWAQGERTSVAPARRSSLRRLPGAVTVAGCLIVAAGCSNASGNAAGSAPSRSGAPATTASPATTGPAALAADVAPKATTTVPAADGPLANATTDAHSAPAEGEGAALLRSVRVGSHRGFERIVFEFEGPTRPGYRIRWVDGAVTADGSGQPVELVGPVHLEVVLEPASGVDMDSGRIVYTGPDRVVVGTEHPPLRDVVRTGDFESISTWVLGLDAVVPYRVLTLQSPTRLVVDVTAS